MDIPTKEIVLSAVRLLILTPFATWFIAHGYAAGQSVEAVSGAMGVLLVAAWGIWDKFKAEKKAAAREQTAVKATIDAVKVLNGKILENPPVTLQQTQALIKEFTDRTNGAGFDAQTKQGVKPP